MTAAEVLASALQAAESDLLNSSGGQEIPGYSLMAEKALRAFKVAQFVVVELPQPDGPLGSYGGVESGLAWRRTVDDGPAGGVATIAVLSGGEIAGSINGIRTPADARWAAAALLAAADAAEVTQ